MSELEGLGESETLWDQNTHLGLRIESVGTAGYLRRDLSPISQYLQDLLGLLLEKLGAS